MTNEQIYTAPSGLEADDKRISLDNGNTFTDPQTLPEADLNRLWDQIINVMDADVVADAHHDLAKRGLSDLPEWHHRRVFLEAYLKFTWNDLVVG